ncbi:MAG: phosphoribosylglycinamide formyltransferase [Pseudomonadota bacterium]
MSSKRRIAVVASGDGSNMQAIADACAAGDIDAEIGLVLSNVPTARVLERAQALGIAQRCIDHRDFEQRQDFEASVSVALRDSGADLVVLAGFMRILGDSFVRQYYGSLLNIHPSLLPKYRGLHTHRRALEAGDSHAGATVHFVVPELDAGPAVLQARVAVLPDDSPESLARRVLHAEHRIYPRAIAWWAADRLALEPDGAYLDGEVIEDAAALDEASAESESRKPLERDDPDGWCGDSAGTAVPGGSRTD